MRPSLLAIVVFSACALVLSAGQSAHAQFNLQITEIWPGNEPGDNQTEDWFEVTNFGNLAWTAALHGNLYFDDDSADAVVADLMSGVPSIAPGESVVFVNAGGEVEWSDLWDDVVSPLPQVGAYAGAGLGQGGDAVTLFIDDVLPVGPPSLSELDFEAYPSALLDGGQSYDILLGAFSTVGNASGAVATILVNNANQPSIGSPGSVVPEPSAIVLLLTGIVVAFGLRKSK